MKIEPFDFSPTIRQWVDCGEVKRDQLAVLARIGPTTIHRLYHGQSQPDVDALRGWFANRGLPPAFRQTCANAVTDGEGVMVLETELDQDGDGRITEKDARLIDAKKQAVAAERRMLAERAGWRITPEIAAEDQRLSHTEIQLAHAHHRVLLELARQHSHPGGIAR